MSKSRTGSKGNLSHLNLDLHCIISACSGLFEYKQDKATHLVYRLEVRKGRVCAGEGGKQCADGFNDDIMILHTWQNKNYIPIFKITKQKLGCNVQPKYCSDWRASYFIQICL